MSSSPLYFLFYRKKLGGANLSDISFIYIITKDSTAKYYILLHVRYSDMYQGATLYVSPINFQKRRGGGR